MTKTKPCYKLDHIAPIWSRRVKDLVVDEYLGELRDYGRCVVGEAWRYSDDYLEFCNNCVFYAEWFSCDPYSDSVVCMFEQHWNEEHLPS